LTPPPAEAPPSRAVDLALLGATFVIAICGLVYELVAGSVSSYLLGDSVYHFSLVIGLFMTAMGIGAYLSRHVTDPEPAFVGAQIALGLIGGFSAMILFAAFALIENYSAFLFLVSLAIGALVGLEIPLVIRILEGRDALKVTVSNVLTADYIGALAAALLFPLVLVPQLGLMGASFLLGGINLAVAAMGLWLFRARCGFALRAAFLLAVLAVGFGAWQSEATLGAMERRLYENEIVLAQDTPYQRVVVARDGKRVQLFLNGSIQFDTLDEHRYHESLVHPAMTRAPRINSVLILGGGDGMATREVLRYPDVEHVTLVDIDPDVTALFRDHPALSLLNGNALSDPRVQIVNADAWEFLKEAGAPFDVAILDLPDPKDLAVAKLYSRAFYATLTTRMASGGIIVTQATSPLYARKAFWTVEATLAATLDPYAQGRTLATMPYHAYIPSFGEWGFVLAGATLPDAPRRALPEGLRFLDADAFPAMRRFPADMARLDMEPATLFDQPLPRLYEEGWSAWFQ